MKNTISEIKNTLEGINSRLGKAEDRINIEENTQSEEHREKRIKKIKIV